MAFHSKYWSCTPLADWLRGTKKPLAATAEDWDSWHELSKSAHAVRYWLAEEFLDGVQDFITWPARKIHDIKYYIKNRWVIRSNSLTAHSQDIKPGQWRDVGNRFLPCLFNELVDFVEIELAWSHIAWGGVKHEYNKHHRFGLKRWRSKQAGLDNLEWQRKLIHDDEWIGADDPRYGKPTSQAINAQEIYELYIWWTQTYRNRPDPYDASGWTAYCELSRLSNGGKLVWSAEKNPELKKASNLAHKELRKIEAAYEKEDERMMIRLIKVRDSLWT